MEDSLDGFLVNSFFMVIGFLLAYCSAWYREKHENERKRNDVLREKYEEILEAINFLISQRGSGGKKDDQKKAISSINKIYLYVNEDLVKIIEELQKNIDSYESFNEDSIKESYLKIINYMRRNLGNKAPELQNNLNFKKYPEEVEPIEKYPRIPRYNVPNVLGDNEFNVNVNMNALNVVGSGVGAYGLSTILNRPY